MIEQALEAIESAEQQGLLRGHDESVLSGFSGRKLVGALQRLAGLWNDTGQACYLEIGVFQGLTLLSVAAANPRLACYGVDNFAFFDPHGTNLKLVEERRAKLRTTNAQVINLDYEDALENLGAHIGGRKIGVYFVDGPHDYRSQLMCLELALPYLHQQAVIVVDDSNYRHVRQANRDFLVTHPEYALVFEAYTARHPSNMNPADNAAARAGWWNGVNILMRDVERRIVREYPPTLRSRQLFENEHYVHATNVAAHVGRAIGAAQMLDERNWRGLVSSVMRLSKDMKATHDERRGLFRSLNTYSHTLPVSRYCTMGPGQKR